MAVVLEEMRGSESVQPTREPAGMMCSPTSANSGGASRMDRRAMDADFMGASSVANFREFLLVPFS
jgi:hypothetical protein